MPRALPRGVYAIADGSAGRPVGELVGAFVRGGARIVQLRLKAPAPGAGLRAPGFDAVEILRLAREARRICSAGGAMLFINDRPDIARLAEADGVHLGQEDLPWQEARKIVGPDMIVGVSTHSDEEIDAAQGADYIGFGPIFATRSKPGAVLPPPHGIGGLRRAVHRSNIPVVAIGGITAANAREVAVAGATCAAAIAELCSAPDPEQATRAMVAAFESGARSPEPGAGR